MDHHPALLLLMMMMMKIWVSELSPVLLLLLLSLLLETIKDTNITQSLALISYDIIILKLIDL